MAACGMGQAQVDLSRGSPAPKQEGVSKCMAMLPRRQSRPNQEGTAAGVHSSRSFSRKSTGPKVAGERAVHDVPQPHMAPGVPHQESAGSAVVRACNGAAQLQGRS